MLTLPSFVGILGNNIISHNLLNMNFIHENVRAFNKVPLLYQVLSTIAEVQQTLFVLATFSDINLS